jgi:hypothetical protein
LIAATGGGFGFFAVYTVAARGWVESMEYRGPFVVIYHQDTTAVERR